MVRGSHRGPLYDNSGAFAEYAGDGPAIRAKRPPKNGLPRLPEVNELRKTQTELICSWDRNKPGDLVVVFQRPVLVDRRRKISCLQDLSLFSLWFFFSILKLILVAAATTFADQPATCRSL